LSAASPNGVRTYDPVLRRWFRAATQEALLLVLNSPRFVNMRNARKAREAEEDERNKSHGQEQLARAQEKRDRKNVKRTLLDMRDHCGAHPTLDRTTHLA